MEISQVEKYVTTVIPNLERELVRTDLGNKELLELYNLYVEVLRIVAPYDFATFNKYLELDEDSSSENRAFYNHRKNHIGEIFQALNDMEVYDKYDLVLISLAPRVGKTTTGIRFLSWICGRHPENTQLATSYSDAVTGSFYIGVMEVLQHERYKEVFTDTPVVYQNAKKQEIWVKVMKRYPTISFVSVGGSMTGRAEAGNYLYCDDLVNGLEEALSITRLEKLWGIYTVNCKQRKKDGCKEIHIATRWSVHDPITKLAEENADNPRCKIISVPCYNEEGESNFDFLGGFGTAYYKELQSTMDEASFNALYLCEPIEREGLLYLNDELQYYFELPDEQPDTIVAICDSKNMGTDFVCSPIGYVYGDFIFVEDVVYNDGLPDITRPLVAEKWVEHKVIRADVEMNNGGNYYAEDLDKMIHDKGGRTSIRTFFSSNNKRTKIITYSDYVKKHFVFKDKSKYSPNSEYAKFMKALLSWTQSGKNKNDDAPDAVAMLAQLVQDLQGMSIQILDRKALKL